MPLEVDDRTMSDAGDPKDPAQPLTAGEAEAAAAQEAATEVAEAEAAAAAHPDDHQPGAGHEGAHADADHDAHGGHGGHDDEEPLGPIDLRAWAASVLGVAAAAAVVAAFAVADGLI
jgi:hypothetical protein